MSLSSVKFGTSGLRGLAAELSGGLAAAYARAFAVHLADEQNPSASKEVYVASDLRNSGVPIKRQVFAGLISGGLLPVDCGFVPTPALALAAMSRSLPCIMVTGSHISAERNGLKFYTAKGEITKPDEEKITNLAQHGRGPMIDSADAARTIEGIDEEFLQRYDRCFPEHIFKGLRIGVYEHSTVLRDILVTSLERRGAIVLRLGRSDTFTALDTENINDHTRAMLRRWCALHQLDAIVSADGDGDRPLIANEAGQPINGDVIGLITVTFLGASAVVTPVTSNSGVERRLSCRVFRTQVGSPYVIAGMVEAVARGVPPVIGFEANGGVLLGNDVMLQGCKLSALPTRDSLLPILCLLSARSGAQAPLSQIVNDLGLPATAARKLESVPGHVSYALLQKLARKPHQLASFLKPFGTVSSVDLVDGIRATLSGGQVIHFRASGNEPALRCYVEAGSENEANALLRQVAFVVESHLKDPS